VIASRCPRCSYRTKLIKFSPEKNATFDHIREESEEDSGIGIRKLCPTRWTIWEILQRALLEITVTWNSFVING